MENTLHIHVSQPVEAERAHRHRDVQVCADNTSVRSLAFKAEHHSPALQLACMLDTENIKPQAASAIEAPLYLHGVDFSALCDHPSPASPPVLLSMFSLLLPPSLALSSIWSET